MKPLYLATAVFIFFTSLGSMQAAVSEPIKPEQLYQQGEHALAQGNSTLALEYWRQALAAYDHLKDQAGIRLTLIAQTRAAHQLGHYRDACETLLLAFEQNGDRTLCLPEAPEDVAATHSLIHTLQAQEYGATGLLSLGTSLEHLGKYESGIAVFEALLKSEQLDSANHNKIALSLANLYHTQFLYARNRYQIGDQLQALTLIKTAGIKSFQGYQALFNVAQPDVALAAKVNSFLLAADLAQWAGREVAEVIPEIASIQAVQPDLKGLLTELKSTDFTDLLPIVALQCRLRFADGLRRLIQAHTLLESDLEVAHTQANLALKAANALQLPRIESEAAGLLGLIYLQNEKQTDSFQAFDYARSKALSIRADDLTFQWEWQQARLEPDSDRALALLASALSHADRVRANLFSGTTDRQISFQTEIAPIYRDYLELLLKQPKPDLQQAIAVHDRLQLAELETFLQCGRLPAVPIQKLPSSVQPITFHILDLGTHIEVIVSSKDLSLHRFSIPADNVKSNAKNLRDLILDSRFKLLPLQAFLPFSQALFQALIAPAQNAGLLHPNDTLLFQTDHFLSNIPLAILYDGNHYLVENYSISNRLSPFIAQPTKIAQKSVNALLLGLAAQSPSAAKFHFSPLRGVSEELKLVANSTHSTKILLNQNFTLDAFNHAIANSNAPIIHISTHGQFSSDSAQTFLLAWDQPILFKQIDVLFRSRPRILDLLFLSACQTAQGDDNSILGLAGMTVRAGASSTIASVWLVNADSTTELVSHFYHALTSGQSRADALRSAQLSLINSQQFAHPYFWAPFILIGNWL